MKPTDSCPSCKQYGLFVVMCDEPYNIAHLQCRNCDSTYTLDYRPMWQEEINGVAADVCDFVEHKLKMLKIELTKEQSDEIFDKITDVLDEYGYGMYKNHN